MTTATRPSFLNPRSRLQAPLLWLLTFAMMLGPIVFLQQNGFQGWGYAPILAALIIAWGVFSTRYLSRLPRWERDSTKYRAAEIVLLLLAIRLFTWFVIDGFPNAEAWREILRAPSVIFGGAWAGYSVVCLFAWSWSLGLVALFAEMEVSDYEERFYSMPSRERQQFRVDTPLRQHRTPLLNEFFRRWIYGGMILIFATALTTVRVEEITETAWFTGLTRLPIPMVLLMALMLYFFTGFWLLSYARYTVLYARWLGSGTQPHPTLARAWRRRSLLTLGLIGTLAAFLPIGSSLPILYVVRGIAWLSSIIFYSILGLIGLLAGLLLREDQEAVQEEALPIFEQPRVDMSQFSEPVVRDPLPPEIIGGITLVIVAIVIIVALVIVIRGRNYGSLSEATSGFWAQLRAWWRSLWGEVSLRVLEAREALAQRLARPDERGDVTTPRRRVRLNALTPREQIRYFYLSAVRRAAQKGVVRHPEQTPAEFLQELESEWPDSAEDSQLLTDAFLQARYSRDDVDNEVGVVKQTWKRVRSSIRRKK